MFKLPPRLQACVCGFALIFGFGAEPSRAQPTVLTQARVAAALPGLEKLARRLVAADQVPGIAIAVVFDDKVVYLAGFGHREAGKAELVDADTVFQLASLSKPITSTIVASLVSDGVVDWSSRISDLDPSFRLYDPYPTSQVTVRDFLAHRSGLPGSAGDDLEAAGFGRDEILRRLRFVPPSSSFRAGYAYSNQGFTEGAVASVRPTGKAWETVADERLYKPLGMASTSSRHADFLTRADRATLHIKVAGVWTPSERDADPQSPAGGVSASVRDLAQWLRLELADGVFNGKPLIAAKAMAETHAPIMARGANPVTGAPSFYAMGWNVEYGRHGLNWSHAGAFSAGAQTTASLYPEAHLGIVVLTNGFPTGVPEGVADSFADLVFEGRLKTDWITPWRKLFDSMFGPDVAATKAAYASPPSSPSPAMPLATYRGRYSSPYAGEAVVETRGDALVLKVGPGGARAWPLRHFNRDLFVCSPDADAPDRPSTVSFTIGPDGKASTVTIESLNAVGLGTLTRER